MPSKGGQWFRSASSTLYAEGSKLNPWHLQLSGSSKRQWEKPPGQPLPIRVDNCDHDRSIVWFSRREIPLYSQVVPHWSYVPGCDGVPRLGSHHVHTQHLHLSSTLWIRRFNQCFQDFLISFFAKHKRKTFIADGEHDSSNTQQQVKPAMLLTPGAIDTAGGLTDMTVNSTESLLSHLHCKLNRLLGLCAACHHCDWSQLVCPRWASVSSASSFQILGLA